METLEDSLQQTRVERTDKLKDHYESTATSTHERLADRCNRADADLEVITSALYKHSPFAQVHLTSARLQGQLMRMEEELERRDGELVEAQGNELSLSDAKVRAFIAKYGGR